MLSKIKLLFAVCLLFVCTAGQAQQYFNVTKYGAKNDSSKLATEAIKKAIAAASKVGGGTVYFPAGKYLTGPIHLKSNITLFIDAGAELHFSDNFDHYLPMVESRWEGTEVTNFSPLIYANNVENIAIIGRGTIDGHGKNWWRFSEVEVKKLTEDSKWQKEFKRLNPNVLAPDLPGWIERGFLRPPFIQFLNSKNIQIKDVKIQNSPFWTINPQYCENINVDGITLINPPSPNTDGINPESCKNVRIANCYISVGDDCITIKSGKDRSGRKVNIPAENYVITNCTMLKGHGGVVIGSEMSGGVKNIAITNCIFDGTDRGIRLKSARGRGGVVEDIRVNNVIMRNIRDQAIVMDMQYAKTTLEPVSERTPIFRNIHISDITASTNRAGFLNGLEEMPLENISFTNVNMTANNGFLIKNAKDISFNNVQVNSKSSAVVTAENVSNLQINGVKSLVPQAGIPIVDLTNVNQAYIHNSFPVAGTAIFLSVKGDKSGNIVLQNNNLINVKTAVDAAKGIIPKITATGNVEKK